MCIARQYCSTFAAQNYRERPKEEINQVKIVFSQALMVYHDHNILCIFTSFVALRAWTTIGRPAAAGLLVAVITIMSLVFSSPYVEMVKEEEFFAAIQ